MEERVAGDDLVEQGELDGAVVRGEGEEVGLRDDALHPPYDPHGDHGEADTRVEGVQLGDQLGGALARAEDGVHLLGGLRRALQLVLVQALSRAAFVVPRVAHAGSVRQEEDVLGLVFL